MRARVLPVRLPAAEPSRINPTGERHACEAVVHGQELLTGSDDEASCDAQPVEADDARLDPAST
jgi:hypothetical protein